MPDDLRNCRPLEEAQTVRARPRSAHAFVISPRETHVTDMVFRQQSVSSNAVMPLLCLNHTKISPHSHRPSPFFEPIPCATLTICEGAPVRQQEQEVGAGDARSCVQ